MLFPSYCEYIECKKGEQVDIQFNVCSISIFMLGTNMENCMKLNFHPSTRHMVKKMRQKCIYTVSKYT